MFTTTLILAAVGGLNWGLIALFDFNLVAALFGFNTVLTDLVYLIVGLSAAYVLVAQLMHVGQSSHSDNRYREREPAHSHH